MINPFILSHYKHPAGMPTSAASELHFKHPENNSLQSEHTFNPFANSLLVSQQIFPFKAKPSLVSQDMQTVFDDEEHYKQPSTVQAKIHPPFPSGRYPMDCWQQTAPDTT